jgi:hypothetical protein
MKKGFVNKNIEARIAQIPALPSSKLYDHGEQSYLRIFATLFFQLFCYTFYLVCKEKMPPFSPYLALKWSDFNSLKKKS